LSFFDTWITACPDANFCIEINLEHYYNYYSAIEAIAIKLEIFKIAEEEFFDSSSAICFTHWS